MNTNELIEKYGISKSQLDYENKRAIKKGYSLEDWLNTKYEAKEIWDNFLQRYNNIGLEFKTSKDVREFLKDLMNSQWWTVLDYEKDISEGLESEDLIDAVPQSFGKVTKDDVLKDFLKVQIKITNTGLFWLLFNEIYSNFDLPSLYIEDFRKIFNQHNRLSMPIEERINYFNEVIIKMPDGLKDRDNIINFLKNYKDDDDIILYRGFMVDKDERIMENGKQLHGIGLSYTWDKEKAIAFSLRFNHFAECMDSISYFVKSVKEHKELDAGEEIVVVNEIVNRFLRNNNVLKENDEDIRVDWNYFLENKKFRDKLLKSEKTLQQMITFFKNKNSEVYITSGYDSTIKQDDTRRSYIAKYKVKKNKIITAIGYHNELVIMPNDIEMISYEVVDMNKIKANKGIHLEKDKNTQ